MIDRKIEELTQPPDFEIRAEIFIKQVERPLAYTDFEPTFLFVENRTKELPRMFQEGMKFLYGEAGDVSDGVDDELKETTDEVRTAANKLDDLLGGNLRGMAEDLERQVDIDSANLNEVEVTIVDGSRKLIKDLIRKIDQIALRNGGIRDGGKPHIHEYPYSEDYGDEGRYGAEVTYVFR